MEGRVRWEREPGKEEKRKSDFFQCLENEEGPNSISACPMTTASCPLYNR